MSRSDREIAEDFFAMLERHGVHVARKGFKATIVPEGFSDNNTSTLLFSFNEAGEYQRIDGYVGNRYGTFYMAGLHRRKK